MTWTAPRTYIAGEIVTAAILNTDVRDNLTYLNTFGVVTAFTPVWTGLTLGDGYTGGHVYRINGIVFFTAVLVAGSTTSGAAGTVYLNYPITSGSMYGPGYSGGFPLGDALFISDTGETYKGSLQFYDTAKGRVMWDHPDYLAGIYNALTEVWELGITPGDRVFISGRLEL